MAIFFWYTKFWTFGFQTPPLLSKTLRTAPTTPSHASLHPPPPYPSPNPRGPCLCSRLQYSHLLRKVLQPQIDALIDYGTEIPLNKNEAWDFFAGERQGHYNASQRHCIHECHWRRNVVLVQGPPGTGKTETIVGMLLYSMYVHATLVAKNWQPRPPPPRVLICSPTNVAIDNVLDRLSHWPEVRVRRCWVLCCGPTGCWWWWWGGVARAPASVSPRAPGARVTHTRPRASTHAHNGWQKPQQMWEC